MLYHGLVILVHLITLNKFVLLLIYISLLRNIQFLLNRIICLPAKKYVGFWRQYLTDVRISGFTLIDAMAPVASAWIHTLPLSSNDLYHCEETTTKTTSPPTTTSFSILLTVISPDPKQSHSTLEQLL